MRAILLLTAVVSAIFLQHKPAAAHRFSVALVVAVSGPLALPGKQARDGFLLATTERDAHPDQESDGHLGGLDVYVEVIDPRQNPATARAAIGKLIDRGGVDFVIAAGDPKVLGAIHPLVTGARIFLIGASPAPPVFAGVKCNPFFFSVSRPREGAGEQSKNPIAAQWAHDLASPANRAFVAAFEKAYGYPPTPQAAMGYEAARLIASAVRAREGALADGAAVRAALRRADFRSIRGNFKFNANQFPIQDRYLVRLVRRADGARISRVVRKLATMRGDRYAANCAMK